MNRVGYLRSYIPRTASGEGDLIPIPSGNQGCTLELTIISCFARVVNPHKHNGLTTDSHTIPRWVLFKIPELTLVNQYGKEVVGNHIEYKTWLRRKVDCNDCVNTMYLHKFRNGNVVGCI